MKNGDLITYTKTDDIFTDAKLIVTIARKRAYKAVRFLPQLEMRPSSNAPSPVESREAPPTSSFPGFSEPP